MCTPLALPLAPITGTKSALVFVTGGAVAADDAAERVLDGVRAQFGSTQLVRARAPTPDNATRQRLRLPYESEYTEEELQVACDHLKFVKSVKFAGFAVTSAMAVNGE
jgi:hypothetical protein